MTSTASGPPLRKRFGQHFLIDQYVIDQIVALIGATRSDHILEIGPGGGVLTRALVGSGAHVVAVEIDRDLSRQLNSAFADAANFVLRTEDILTFDFDCLREQARQWKIVGNLPYNISTPLIMRLLEQTDICSEMTFMLQREVAERLTADVGSRAYGRLGLMAQRRALISLRLAVGPESFAPPPKVDSAVVQLRPCNLALEPKVEERLSELVRIAFTHRRKTIANGLRDQLPKDLYARCDIDPGSRPEVLSSADFEKLARASLALD